MREHRVGIHFISCTFQFLIQNPQLRPCQGRVILRHGEDWDLVPTLSSEHFILGYFGQS